MRRGKRPKERGRGTPVSPSDTGGWGGANARKTRYERLRNFYVCKLKNQEFRLTHAPAAEGALTSARDKIDLRKSLQKIFDGAINV